MARKVERQFRRTCIFCGTPAKMTDEHVWGDWVRKFLPHAANSHEQHSRTIAKDGQDRIALRKRAGNVLGATVPVVCKDCNSGWLSRIQTAGKRHLPALFAAKRHIITQESQKAIATWATMATITAEYTHPKGGVYRGHAAGTAGVLNFLRRHCPGGGSGLDISIEGVWTAITIMR